MKNLTLTAFLVTIIQTVSGQINATTEKFTIVHHPEYFKEEGVIFGKDYDAGILISDLQYRFTPDDNDTRKADSLFNEQYNQVQKSNINTRDHFCNWVRQYLGLVDRNGHKNIIMQLVNNKKPRKINKLLGHGWQKNFTIMLGDEFYSVSTRFRINIDTGEMSTEL